MEKLMKIAPHEFKELDENISMQNIASQAWQLERINVEQAWEITQGEDMIIALLDTGLRLTHEALQSGQIIEVKNFTTDDGGNASIVTDYNGHGTAMAGILVGESPTHGTIGIAPKAKIIFGKIGVGVTGSAPLANTAAGFQWATNWRGPNGEKVDVISLSFETSYNVQLLEAFKNAIDAGITVCVAAGNDSTSYDYNVFEYQYLPSLKECVSVAAMISNENQAHYSTNNTYVDVFAPTDTFTTSHTGDINYRTSNGTSSACPVAAGFTTLMLSAYEKAGQPLSPEKAQKILKTEFTRPSKYANGLLAVQQGYGVIDFAVKKLPKPDSLFPLESSKNFFDYELAEVPTGIKYIRPEKIWQRNRGENSVVAILSTGVDIDHTSLQGQILDGRNFTNENGGIVTNYNDTNGMGTMCAGIVASTKNLVGVASHSKIVVGKIQNADLSFNVESVLEALEWARSWIGPNGEKIDVVLSTFSYMETDVNIYPRHGDIFNAIKKLENVAFITGSGDVGDGSYVTDEKVYPGMIPAPSVITVGGMRPYFDNAILEDYLMSTSATHGNVDLIAPGENVNGLWLNNITTTSKKSTQYAAAHAAGACALIVSTNKKSGIILKNGTQILGELQKFLRMKMNEDIPKNENGHGAGSLNLSWGEWPKPIEEEIVYVFEEM